MIAALCAGLNRVQPPISAKVRPHPKQLLVRPSTAQTLMHGVSMGAVIPLPCLRRRPKASDLGQQEVSVYQ
jgi:hypothetical protein